MLLSDVVSEGGRIWLKSEWEPAGENWPAVSFSKRSVGELLGREFRPQQDALIYVGTTNPLLTKDPTPRQRLLSAMKIEPKQLLETRECVSPATWERAQQDFRGRWYWSMPALEMWSIEGFPRASDVVPQSYSLLGLIENRGNVVEVVPHEKAAVLKLGLRRIPFEPARKSADFGKTRNFLSLSASIRSEISRMASGIVGRVERSGTEHVRVNPPRTMGETDINIMLGARWEEQGGRCFCVRVRCSPEQKTTYSSALLIE